MFWGPRISRLANPRIELCLDYTEQNVCNDRPVIAQETLQNTEAEAIVGGPEKTEQPE